MDIYLICTYILSGILGLCVGSFLNVVIYRVPRGMSLVQPASHCTGCGYYLKWYDNIPLISWLALGGKCRKCRQPISVRYVAVELMNSLLWLLSVWCFWETEPFYAVIIAIVCSCLICVLFIDAEHMLIYNRFVILIAALGAVAMFFDRYTTVQDHIIGCLFGGGIFVFIYYGSIVLMKKEGIGFGDVKLVFALGLLLGWQKFLLAILIGSLAGSVVLITLNRLDDRAEGTEHPFGPFIVSGVFFALFFGEGVIDRYINLLLV